MHARDHESTQNAGWPAIPRLKASAPLAPTSMPFPTGDAATASAASVQALQHKVGNTAVTLMVQRSTSPAHDTEEMEEAALFRQFRADALRAMAWLEENPEGQQSDSVAGSPAESVGRPETPAVLSAEEGDRQAVEAQRRYGRRREADPAVSFLPPGAYIPESAANAAENKAVKNEISANRKQWANDNQVGILVTRDFRLHLDGNHAWDNTPESFSDRQKESTRRGIRAAFKRALSRFNSWRDADF